MYEHFIQKQINFKKVLHFDILCIFVADLKIIDMENLKIKDTIEQKINSEKHTRIVLDKVINPFNGHITYEIDDFKKTITVAELSVVFTEVPKTVHWFDILKSDFGKKFVIIKKPNCRYESRLNVDNLKRKVRGIDDYVYIPKKHNSGSYQSIDVKTILK